MQFLIDFGTLTCLLLVISIHYRVIYPTFSGIVARSKVRCENASFDES